MSEETKEKDFDTLVRAYGDSVGLEPEDADAKIQEFYNNFNALYIKGSFNINDKYDREAHTPFAESIAANPALFNALDAKVRLENDGEGIQERLAAAKNTYWAADPARKTWDYVSGQKTQEETERKLYEPWGFKKGAGDKDWTRKHVPSAEQNLATSEAADKVHKRRKEEDRARRGEEIAQMPPGPQKTEALMDLELDKTLDDIGYQDDPNSSPDDYNRLYNEPAEKSLDNPAPGQPNAQAPAAPKDDSIIPGSELSRTGTKVINAANKMDDDLKSGNRSLVNQHKQYVQAYGQQLQKDAIKEHKKSLRDKESAANRDETLRGSSAQNHKRLYDHFRGEGAYDKLTPQQKADSFRNYMTMPKDDPRWQGKTLDQPSGTMGGALQYTPPPLEEDMVPGEPGPVGEKGPMGEPEIPSDSTYKVDPNDARAALNNIPNFNQPAPQPAPPPAAPPIPAPRNDFAGAPPAPGRPVPTQAEAEAAGDPFLGMDAPALPEPEAYVSADTPMPKPAPRTPEEEKKFQEFVSMDNPTAHIIRQGVPQGQYKGFEKPNLDNIRFDPLDYQKTTDRGWWDRDNTRGAMVPDNPAAREAERERIQNMSDEEMDGEAKRKRLDDLDAGDNYLDRPVQSPYHAGNVAMSYNAQVHDNAYRRGASFADPATSTFNSTAQQGSAGKYSIRGPGGHLTDKIPVFGKNGIVGYRTKGLMRDEVVKQGMFTNPIVRGNQAEDERLKRKYGLEGTEFGNKYRPQYVA